MEPWLARFRQCGLGRCAESHLPSPPEPRSSFSRVLCIGRCLNAFLRYRVQGCVQPLPLVFSHSWRCCSKAPGSISRSALAANIQVKRFQNQVGFQRLVIAQRRRESPGTLTHCIAFELWVVAPLFEVCEEFAAFF